MDMSREARRSKISDSVHNRSEYILGVSGDLGVKIKSSCESEGDELLKLLQNVSPSNVALASGVVATLLPFLRIGISEILRVTLLIAFQNSLFPGLRFLKNCFLELLRSDTTLLRVSVLSSIER